MKKFSRTHIVAALMALLVIIGGVSVGVSAEDEKIYSERYFHYIIENEQVTIIDYFGSESEVVIYDHIASLPVTRIRGQIFRSNPALTKVTIPDTVTRIDSDLFTGLPNLKTVVVQSKSITVKVPEGCTIVEDYPIYIDPSKIDTGSAAVTTTPAPVTLPPVPVTTTTPAETTTPVETTTASVGFEDAAGDADDTTTAVTTPPDPETTTPAPVTTAPVTTPEVTTSDTVPADTSATEPSGTTPDTTPSDTTPSGTSYGTTPASESGTTTQPQTPSGDDSNGVNVVVIVVVAVVVVAAAVVGISASLKRSKRR